MGKDDGAYQQAVAGQLLSGISVLLAEDDEAVRGLIAEHLRNMGGEVWEAADGVAAVALFKASPNSFGLAVLDHTMPHRRGAEVFADLHAARPDLPVLMISGNPGDIPLESLAAMGLKGFLYKPFCCCEFAKAVLVAVRRWP